MAQTESMIRLLLDGEIAGYMRIIPVHLKYLDCDLLDVQFSKSLTGKWKSVKTQLDISEVIDCDSFEQGIKVGDEWWFGGDRISFYNDIHDRDDKGTIIQDDNGGLYIKPDRDSDVILNFGWAKNITVIGNIHEGQTNGS